MPNQIDPRFKTLAAAKKDANISSLLDGKNTSGLIVPSLTRLVQSGIKTAKLLSTEPRVESGVNSEGEHWVRVGCPIALNIDGKDVQFLRNIEGTSLKTDAKLVLTLDQYTPEGAEKPITFVRAYEESFYKALQKAEKQAVEA